MLKLGLYGRKLRCYIIQSSAFVARPFEDGTLNLYWLLRINAFLIALQYTDLHLKVDNLLESLIVKRKQSVLLEEWVQLRDNLILD